MLEDLFKIIHICPPTNFSFESREKENRPLNIFIPQIIT